MCDLALAGPTVKLTASDVCPCTVVTISAFLTRNRHVSDPNYFECELGQKDLRVRSPDREREGEDMEKDFDFISLGS